MLGRETKRAEEVDASLHASRSARDGSLVPGRGHGASSAATPETAALGSAAPGAAGLNSAAPYMAVLGPAARAKATLCPARFRPTALESGAQLGGGAWLRCAGDGCARPCSAAAPCTAKQRPHGRCFAPAFATGERPDQRPRDFLRAWSSSLPGRDSVFGGRGLAREPCVRQGLRASSRCHSAVRARHAHCSRENLAQL